MSPTRNNDFHVVDDVNMSLINSQCVAHHAKHQCVRDRSHRIITALRRPYGMLPPWSPRLHHDNFVYQQEITMMLSAATMVRKPEFANLKPVEHANCDRTCPNPGM